MPSKIRPRESQIKVLESPQALRSGGEARPFDYPHLYQIQAGDWRISYAVEHNRLAILVLEVLHPDSVGRKDSAQEQLTRKMKVKLLDWPEGSPSRDLPPEELGKKVKIKLLDLADEAAAEDTGHRQSSRIKFSNSLAHKSGAGKIRFVDSSNTEGDQESADQPAQGDESSGKRKVTPVDSPTV